MSKWGIRSMIWYIFILIIAFCVSIYYYIQFMSDPSIATLFY